MNTIEFQQHPLSKSMWLLYLNKQLFGTLSKIDGTLSITQPIMLSPSMLNQMQEQSNIDYCLAQDKYYI